jgi:SNF family Na+-dependent transporter
MIFIGIPLLYLETAVGQMHQQTIPKIYQKINSGFKMFGYIVIFVVFYISTYYNLLLTYSYRFVFTAFIHPLPFMN